MNVSLYQAAAAMNATSQWQELISENLAASGAPGSRKQDVSFSSIEAGLPSRELGLNGDRFAMPAFRSYTDFSEGEMHPTGVSTDLAIDGPAFFQVQLPNGQNAFTRDGSFQVNAQGVLVTQQGYPVQSDGGTPVQLDPTDSGAITISATGEVTQGDQPRGKIRLDEFSDPQKLTQITGGYFIANDPTIKPAAAKASQLRQGYLEGGNGSPTTEMASLITAMRLFETNQKVLQAQDDRMGRIISDLGGTGS